MTKITSLPEQTTPTTADYTVMVDMTAATTKKVKWSNLTSVFSSLLLPVFHPVGSLYIETTGTNPATTWGFGTWTQYAQGQALVGVAPSGTFSTAGHAVGSETHAITIDEMPSHTHVETVSGTTSGGTLGINGETGYSGSNGSDLYTEPTGGGIAMSLVQPSMPVYIWQRTA